MLNAKFPYYMFMAESEGHIGTREGKINRVIAEVRAYADSVMPEAAFCLCLERNGIEPESLTEREFQHISNAIKN